MRLAWFSPWPPQKSGIAGRSAELVPILARRGHAIDVFVDASRVPTEPLPADPPRPGGVRVLSAHDFLWRQARGHYDLPVYQIGNSHLHRFIWPYLFRFPGLVVFHDARVHHARAEALLSQLRTDDYRAEFAWSHPDVPPAAAEFAVQDFGGAFYYQWPMRRGVVESARLVATHSRGVAALLADEAPHRPLHYIALGEGPRHLDVAAAGRQFRAAHGLPESAIVFGVHGGLSAEKRVVDVIRAFALTRPWVPDARLLLVGAADAWLGVDDQIGALGIGRAVCQVRWVSDAEFDPAIAACDVTLNLRWPTALETSGPWVRALACGKATVIIDTPHHGHVPALDPRTWRRPLPCADLEPGADDRAVTVSLDLHDIRHSLRLAMRRLGADAALRERLGRQARRWWEQEHTVERMTTDYEDALARAAALPDPEPDWPAHMRPDAAAHARRLLDGAAWSGERVRARLGELGI